MIFKVNDQIQSNGKYYNCICADEMSAVFGPIIRKKDCLRTSYKNMFVFPNDSGESLNYKRVIIKQWTGSLKPFIPIQNAIKASEIDENKTLTVFTRKGKIVFKKGQYIKSCEGIISKP